MLNFLKRFGLGILYVVVSPFLFAFLALWVLYLIGVFFVELIGAIISFFKGKKFFQDFPEDIEARRILSLQQYQSTPEIKKEETNQ